MLTSHLVTGVWILSEGGWGTGRRTGDNRSRTVGNLEMESLEWVRKQEYPK